MKNQLKKVRNKLINRARKLAGMGYSIIPIQGDASAGEPKKPTIKWRAFQRRIADGHELQGMFDGRARALGVVCGQVSQLLVIDFDDHLRYQRFCRHLPQYAESYTVKTRRGYHVYFRTREKVPSHQFDGGDIKGEKSYVVAPPSVIAGFEYRAVRACARVVLNKAGVDEILNYFHVRASVPVGPDVIQQVRGDLDIAALYRRLRAMVGRNNALYRCASAARQAGMSIAEIEEQLVRLHVCAEGEPGHKYESVADRLTEAQRTIRSAGRSGGRRRGDVDGIPNTVRERLLQAQGSAVSARLLDIMYMAGWQPESLFCMRDAIKVCAKYGLNRKSVMAALTGERCYFDGRHIISRRYVEYLDIAGLNLGKRGRRVQLLFQVPSVSRLLGVLGVSWSPSDRLVKADVASSHAYRRALHREYVKRLSPQAPMSVLACRLGLNARTLRRYNAELGVHVCERIGRFALTWDTLKCLPRRARKDAKNQTPGYWLSVGDSARFPAWRHVGAALLRSASGAVQVCVRRASVLSLGERRPRSTVYEAMSVDTFMRLRVWRGGSVEGRGLLGRLGDLASNVRARASRVRYEKVRLQYNSVAAHIANDKVAETIRGYLYAQDGLGREIRRPARRGVAYRMLKEFGEGNVYLAVRDFGNELLASMARHAFRVGDEESGMGLLVRSMG